jgi:hypothetical protein
MSRFNVIWVVQPLSQKYSAFAVGQITATDSRYPVPLRGALAIVTNVGTGCGGRGSVACAIRSQGGSFRERSAAHKTNNAEAYGKTVWSWHPLLVSSWRRRVGPTGLGQVLIRWRRRQDEFVSGESKA